LENICYKKAEKTKTNTDKVNIRMIKIARRRMEGNIEKREL
jgi:hypothetical protein